MSCGGGGGGALRDLPVGLVLALPLALQDPLPHVLRAVGGVQGQAWRGRALAAGLQRPPAHLAAVAGGETELRSKRRPLGVALI